MDTLFMIFAVIILFFPMPAAAPTIWMSFATVLLLLAIYCKLCNIHKELKKRK